MADLLSSLITEEMRMAFVVICVMLACLYVLSIVWVIRDAYQRGTQWVVWGIVAIIPIVGLVAYCLLRPPLLQIDRDEQELEIAYKQRALQKYGNCAVCGCAVQDDFIVCPSCHTPLKNQCMRCGKPLDPTWSMCPYCATPVGGNGGNGGNGGRRRGSRAAGGAGNETVGIDMQQEMRRR